MTDTLTLWDLQADLHNSPLCSSFTELTPRRCFATRQHDRRGHLGHRQVRDGVPRAFHEGEANASLDVNNVRVRSFNHDTDHDMYSDGRSLTC